LKNTLTAKSAEPLRFGLAAAIVFGVSMWFLYPPTFTLNLFVFLLIGLFASLARPEEGGVLSFGKRNVVVSSSSIIFVGSLFAIFLIVGSISGVYYAFQKYLAESYFTQGINIVNTTSDFDGALSKLKNAFAVDSHDDKYLRIQGQVHLAKLRGITNTLLATPTQENLQKFDDTFVQAYEAARKARDLNPTEALNWSLIGAICEAVIPVPPRQRCSEKFLTDTYEAAIQYDPISPQAYLDVGRGWLLTADILQVRISESKDTEEQKKFERDRTDALGKSVSFLAKAAEMKPDFATAHFLSAQAMVRQNDLKGAIKKLEDTQSVAPDDVGVLFQLGFLYYQAANLTGAQDAFERAVSFNENYSNARYFLGLIYDTQGNKPAALDQFQKIQSLNPDNQEVTRIIENLQNNRPALASVVPPLPAPEKRKTPPIKDAGQ
ncbi:MAG: tetratricopeptide repeat protein, partial [Candidatus Sungbacteria bacterium]|nr:tetratricopeptide repeat protein [Candidatus Sungbacteria bacterium]